MTPRSRLTLLAAAIGIAAGLVIPAHADALARSPATTSGLQLADSQRQSPKDRQAPESEAPGCPYRNGKLELIA